MTAFDASSSSGSLAEGSTGQAESAAAENGVVFPTGTEVKCQTALSTTVVGQVLCYDHPTRLLVIKDTTSGQKPLMRFLNLALVEQVSCLRDRPGDHDPYAGSSATPQQVQERLRKAEARKRASLLQTTVSLDGQRAFIHLRKTLDDVRWSGDSISVLDRVLVRPPYTADSVESITTTNQSSNASAHISSSAIAQTKDHVRKILAKMHTVQQTRSSSDDAPADPTPSR